MATRTTCTVTTVIPSKISEQKMYEYIKKMEVDGLPRVRAYAEAIDPHIYDLPPNQISNRLDYIKKNYKGYDDIKAMVQAEQQDWALRRSGAIQNKALDLLSNLIDRANEVAKDPDADVKELNTAISTLRSIMPAFTAVSNAASQKPTNEVNKKARASKFIN